MYKPKPLQARQIALTVLLAVIQQRHSLSDCLDKQLPQLSDGRERGLAQAIAYGVMRYLPRLQFILQTLLSKGLKEKDIDIQIILLIGLYQLLFMRVPAHAATTATVELTRFVNKTWATGLANAILRECVRKQTALLTAIEQDPISHFAHPAWWLAQFQQDWADDWQTIANANNLHPPLTLRVNQRQTSRENYLTLLQEQGINATIVPFTNTGIFLEQAMDVQQLPYFQSGWVSVQDGAAQLAAPLLEVQAGMRVLDACAAPGGKTAHLLESSNPSELVAIDNQAARVETMRQGLQRLNLTATLICADASEPASWWDGQLFDRILLDVPCSASGVIRRHPDIKHLRQASDIVSLLEQQARLLETIWSLLKPNGKLLYATCSVFSQENHLQLQSFLQSHPDARAVPLMVEWGHASPVGRQILSGEFNFDGFYYACLVKQNVSPVSA
ncbi:16S rRNA (cytosine(967)-C(5))-methyltransferase RsmB [Beggiatoa leptomitoformis]|uniref:16S rRNA (cytosine(967)-C(5))-methyltransferase n=1 Tax=Beggiatoa leptomitoformis TaxID=288004 RepID=A0A2N9YIP1_9GAMM|nr:16S rRNA (cytosine(967)-C(5))-methyltransferase RsmB [Beggiatoa leptomitoformis]ALG67499.1 16S rRNA (cytosine(967)-C(5))-methyltransferase RsmB [Beggiatoa leptomitoformis]AUI70279.1 16S rRNA (cytosine(967)-C(5))-methyltransferase RsmB [Beggiatoa leptomitoformis]